MAAGQVGAILLLLTPVGAVLLAFLVLGERPTPLQLLGCVLVLASVQLATQRARSRAEREHTAPHERDGVGRPADPLRQDYPAAPMMARPPS